MQKHTAATATADIASYKELIAVAYCNRALSGLKLNKLQQAEDDCCISIQLNPSVTKVRIIALYMYISCASIMINIMYV
jgi:hypothetical protein